MALAKRWQEAWHCVLEACGKQPAPHDGARAEALAARHLQRQGAKILARNVRYKGGEIDLIVDDGHSIAFVEVRLRQHADFGGAAGSITTAKQARIRLAARIWLAGEGRAYARRNCRFDAVLLDRLDTKNIQWLQAAFDAL